MGLRCDLPAHTAQLACRRPAFTKQRKSLSELRTFERLEPSGSVSAASFLTPGVKSEKCLPPKLLLDLKLR